MSELHLLTNAAEPPSEIMPALGLLLHTVRTGPADMIAFEDPEDRRSGNARLGSAESVPRR